MICPRNRKLRPGTIFIYTMVALVVLLGFVSLAVDVGRVQCAKTELQRAADAAARYAASGVNDNTALAKAIAAARDNLVDGTPLVLDNAQPGTPKDIELGNFDAAQTPKFSSARTPVNAVRVTARRAAARGTGIALLFGGIIGRGTCDIVATSIAQKSGGIPNFIGLDSLAASNNASAGYDPKLGIPGASNLTSGASLASNGSVAFSKNGDISGTVVLGPDGTYTGSTPKAIRLSDDLSYPATENPPFAASGSLVASNSPIVGGGTLVYTSITVPNNTTLIFTQPTTLYVMNDIIFNNSGAIAPASGLPSDLRIRIIGGSKSIVGGNGANTVTITAQIYAPNTDFSAHNNGELRGTALFRSMSAQNNLSLYYDITSTSVVAQFDKGIPTVTMVQ